MNKLLFYLLFSVCFSVQSIQAAQPEKLKLSQSCSCQVSCVDCGFQISELNSAVQMLSQTLEVQDLKKMSFREPLFNQHLAEVIKEESFRKELEIKSQALDGAKSANEIPKLISGIPVPKDCMSELKAAIPFQKSKTATAKTGKSKYVPSDMAIPPPPPPDDTEAVLNAWAGGNEEAQKAKGAEAHSPAPSLILNNCMIMAYPKSRTKDQANTKVELMKEKLNFYSCSCKATQEIK